MQREDEVRLVAYNIWEEEGSPGGRDLEHWFKAEAIWQERQGQTQHVAEQPAHTDPPTPGATRARKRGKAPSRHSL